MTEYKGCYVKLALAVIRQWHNDGCPKDFAFIDVDNPHKGTYYDLWTDTIDIGRDAPIDSIYEVLT